MKLARILGLAGLAALANGTSISSPKNGKAIGKCSPHTGHACTYAGAKYRIGDDAMQCVLLGPAQVMAFKEGCLRAA